MRMYVTAVMLLLASNVAFSAPVFDNCVAPAQLPESDNIRIIPANPAPQAPFAIEITGYRGRQPVHVLDLATTLHGNSIALIGALSAVGFGGVGRYCYSMQVDSGLPVGTYSVALSMGTIDGTGGQILDPPIPVANATFFVGSPTVFSAVPTLAHSTLWILSVIMLGFGLLLSYRSSQGKGNWHS